MTQSKAELIKVEQPRKAPVKYDSAVDEGKDIRFVPGVGWQVYQVASVDTSTKASGPL
jgi:hypothetical protein